MRLRRRTVLAAAASLPLAACRRGPTSDYSVAWVGLDPARGHRLRDGPALVATPDVQRRASVLIVGAGVAGLACARALRRAGIDDVQMLELEDQPGGNSRGHSIAGMACPLGAHYLPVPDERDEALVALLEELGLSRVVGGRRVYDERHLCHSPQERLFIDGQWQDGLLPVQGQSETTLSQYRRFGEEVARAGRELGFRVPTALAPWNDAHAALDAASFADWLRERGFDAPALRTYLDYCCRDDYGAGAGQVSAWAGLHYFASRHGFHSPGDEHDERDGVLTWPQGNGWLTEKLAAAQVDRLHRGRVVMRVEAGRHEVEVDAWSVADTRHERWTAAQVVLAVPLFIAARVLRAVPAALADAVARMRHAPWLVSNLHLDRPLVDRGGAPPAWDNVIHGSAALGYVDAMHQSTRPHAGPTVLTHYWALGGDSPEALRANRQRLFADPASRWADAVIADLLVAHPDLRQALRRVELMRYGHAMSIPVPGLRGSASLRALAGPQGRIGFAHADLSAYSVFEEAFSHGERAAAQVAAFSRASGPRSPAPAPARRG